MRKIAYCFLGLYQICAVAEKNEISWIKLLFNFLGTFIPSRCGGTLLLHNKYSYNKKKYTLSNGRIRWECSSLSTIGCKAYIHTEGSTVVKMIHSHNHQPPKYMYVNGTYVKIHGSKVL